MPSFSKSPVRSLLPFFMAALVALSSTGVARADGDIDQSAVDRAHRFLSTPQQGQYILSFAHFGAAYRSHRHSETRFVKDASGNRIPGEFALVYSFRWDDDGVTELAFLCDAAGNVGQIAVISSNGILQKPFALADATIQILGNLVIEALKNDLQDSDRRELQQIVNSANSRKLLEWALAFRQRVGR